MIARLTGFEGDLGWDTSKPNGQPWRALDTSRRKILSDSVREWNLKKVCAELLIGLLSKGQDQREASWTLASLGLPGREAG